MITTGALDPRAFGLAVGLLLCLGPLELRDGLPLGPLKLTTTELLAAMAASVGAVSLLRGWRQRTLAFPPAAVARWPVLALALWAAVHLASALWAEPPRFEALKAGMRVAGHLGLAALVLLHAGEPAFVRRLRVGALAAVGVIAAMGVCERALGREFEPVLLQFRDEPTWMLGEQRLATVFYHANTCAAFFELMTPVVLVVALTQQGMRRWLWFSLAGVGALLLSVTYSRAGFGAALVGAAVLAWSARLPDAPRWTRRAAIGWWALVLFAYVANPDMRARIGLDERSYRPQYKFIKGCTGYPGDVVQVPLHIKNRGAWALSNRQAKGAAIHVLLDWRGKKTAQGWTWTALPDLPPGAETVVQLPVTLPGPPGDYVLVVDIMRDEVLRISGAGAPLAFVGCGVYERGAQVQPGSVAPVMPASLDAVRVSRMLDLERRHYWRAAILLWERRPWLGWGSDRYHSVHREYVPNAGYDFRARAHSIVLETAADLGLLGLAALGLLLMTLVRTARLAWRHGWRDGGLAIALCAGLCALGVHSMVDYFLGYTQMAVVVWPLIGLLLGLGVNAQVASARQKHGVADEPQLDSGGGIQAAQVCLDRVERRTDSAP